MSKMENCRLECGLENCSVCSKVPCSTLQDPVYVSELNKDVEGLFVKFMGYTTFGRVTEIPDDRVKLERDLNGTA
jgi:hypothetical protein